MMLDELLKNMHGYCSSRNSLSVWFCESSKFTCTSYEPNPILFLHFTVKFVLDLFFTSENAYYIQVKDSE